jgi:YVTN family beta-propeller protein
MSMRKWSCVLLLLPLAWGCGSSATGGTGGHPGTDGGGGGHPPADGSADAPHDAPMEDAGDGSTGMHDGGDASTMEDAGDASTMEDAGDAGDSGLLTGTLLPTGDTITPTAAPGSALTDFNPGIAAVPSFRADHATSTVTSPDGKTLLVLTSGFNMTSYTPATNLSKEGTEVPSESGEWVFVYDISGNGAPAQKQILTLPNSFAGIAFNPSGTEFYVAGGKDDNVHVFDLVGQTWAEKTMTTADAGAVPAPIALGHTTGIGIGNHPQAAGIAVTQDGSKLVVANYENDSISIVDLTAQAVVAELDLRPGKDAASPLPGVAGGEYPFWVVVKGNGTAYVTSQRDREVDVVTFAAVDGGPPSAAVTARIPVRGQPNKMILNKDQSRLFVANGNSDSISIIDTASNTVLETVQVLAPPSVFANAGGLKGANPNGLVLSPDEKTLYVTDGATNAVAVVSRDPNQPTGAQTVGLIPTGWYPTSISTSADGSYLYVTNAKSIPGPSCQDVLDPAWGPVGTLDGGPTEGGGPTVDQHCWNGNQYVWQLETAGLLSLPNPSSTDLAHLTQQVAKNDRFGAGGTTDATMAFLQSHIHHVIYIIKENRTYDQILGDLGTGNGDPTLTMFPQPVTPNLHALATQFVNLDAFLDTGETSGVGWNWTTSAHVTDEIERNQPINYGKGGTTYDWEGTNRRINVGIGTLAARLAANPATPNDPDVLPGVGDVSAPDSTDAETPGTGYLWDAVLRSGKTVRNYGVFVDLLRYSIAMGPLSVPLDKTPFALGHVQAFPANAALAPNTDIYYRGYDQNYPDHWRYLEWKREFDQFVTNNNLPALELVRLAHDHTGLYTSAVAGVNTPLLQVADNDYAVGEVVEAVANSPYAKDTLIFVVEDDAQDGPDHVDAHRSTAYVAGPYVKHGAVVSTHYNTISLVATIEQVLGVGPLGVYDALAAPMSDVFDITQPATFSFQANPSVYLQAGTTTMYALRGVPRLDPETRRKALAELKRTHDAAYWERVMKGQSFDREDDLDVDRFNRALWEGMMGSAKYPARARPSGDDDDDEQAPWCGYLPDGRIHT